MSKKIEFIDANIQPRNVTANIYTMGGNLLDTAKNVIQTYKANGIILASEEKASERLNTCKTCEFFNIDASRCTKCGCFMLPKVHLEAAKCPIEKW